MKTTTYLTLVSVFRGIAAHPSAMRLHVRNCKFGAVVCQGESQFALCDFNEKVVFSSVAEGTKCVCDKGDCAIVGIDSDNNLTFSQDSTPAPASATPSALEALAANSEPPASEPPASEPAVTSTRPASQKEESPAPPVQPELVTPVAAPVDLIKEIIPTVTFASTPNQTPTPMPSSSDSGLPIKGINIGSGLAYAKTFLGNGAASAGWPELDEWASFDSMWQANMKNIIPQSCTSFGQANNSPSESADLKSAIEDTAKSSGVDARFILSIVMQESNGCVRAPTTNYGVTNPGLMQSHNGAHSCFNVSPCPKDQIAGMIKDGTEGTASGDGLKQLLGKQSNVDGAEKFYKAARMYNSGSVAASGQLQDGIATRCYASDIANRLIGWAEGAGKCTFE